MGKETVKIFTLKEIEELNRELMRSLDDPGLALARVEAVPPASELVQGSRLDENQDGSWRGNFKVKISRDYSGGNLSDKAATIPLEDLTEFEGAIHEGVLKGALSKRAFRKIMKVIRIRRLSL